MGNNSGNGPGNRGGQSTKVNIHTAAKNVRPHECSSCAPNSVRHGRLGRCKPTVAA